MAYGWVEWTAILAAAAFVFVYIRPKWEARIEEQIQAEMEGGDGE